MRTRNGKPWYRNNTGAIAPAMLVRLALAIEADTEAVAAEAVAVGAYSHREFDGVCGLLKPQTASRFLALVRAGLNA